MTNLIPVLAPAYFLQFGFLQFGSFGSNSQFSFALPLILMFGIMYFLLFLPMQKQKKQQQKMLAELKSGDVVVTSGGLVGTVTGLDKDTLVIRIKPDNLKLQVTRACVASVVPPPGEAVTQK